MLEELLEQNILTQLDLFFADLHAKTSAERAFLAALMALSREGHLCLDLDHLLLPDVLLAAVKEGAKTASSPYVRRLGNLFYLEKNFTYETSILHQLKQLSFKVKPLDYALSSELYPNNLKNREFDKKGLRIFIRSERPLPRGKARVGIKILRLRNREKGLRDLFLAEQVNEVNWPAGT